MRFTEFLIPFLAVSVMASAVPEASGDLDISARNAEAEPRFGLGGLFKSTPKPKTNTQFPDGKKLQDAGKVPQSKIDDAVNNAKHLRLGNALPAFKGIPIGSVRTRPLPSKREASGESRIAQAFQA